MSCVYKPGVLSLPPLRKHDGKRGGITQSPTRIKQGRLNEVESRTRRDHNTRSTP